MKLRTEKQAPLSPSVTHPQRIFCSGGRADTLCAMSIADIRTFLGAEPVGFFAVLCGIVAGIYPLSETKALARPPDILPCVFWIYFGLLLATFGLFPEKSPAYSLLTDERNKSCEPPEGGTPNDPLRRSLLAQTFPD